MTTTPLDEQTTDRMLDRITASIEGRARRRTRRHRVVALAGVATIALAATAGALVVRQATGVERNIAECYAAASLDAQHTGAVLGAPVGENAPALVDDRARIAQGLDMCAAAWRLGQFEPDPDAAGSGREFTVPPLVPCVLADGRFGYFPSANADVCSRLGLGSPSD
ncbi:hypothetical protein QT381_14890 [Galbitalea sp. SE-J8]|uniref:hypothetical protein n=1 Tax=Galbitalea sp. SE-J8 TaxID=3054952 RepID=UPI00259CC6B4|nr:hypothetical protein [Galbitalea sp. SE-J8]MDM4764291.1 hypothetical protein [Galbitalea sp. SE-J8]